MHKAAPRASRAARCRCNATAPTHASTRPRSMPSKSTISPSRFAVNDKTNDKRPRIVPTWLVYTLTGVVLATMYGVSPRGGLRQRVASVGAPSELSVAYLEAWSKVRPDNEEFLSLLGAQYLYLGRTDDAERIATRMEALGTDDMMRSAMMLHLSVTEQRTFAIPEEDPRRAPALEELRARLTQAAKLPWAPKDLE